MSLIEVMEQKYSELSTNLKRFFLGENNSRLDELFDYFYSIRQEKRTKVMIYAIASLVLLFSLIFACYFFGLYTQQRNLNLAVENSSTLKKYSISYQVVQSQLENELAGMSNNQTGRILAFINAKAEDFGMQITSMPTNPAVMDLPQNHLLASKYKRVLFEFKVTNVSLKRILDFTQEIHKSPMKLKITKLDIQQIYGTKLYFDAAFTIQALVSGIN